MPAAKPITVFISYKWEDDAHNEWVKKLATDLRAAGISAVLDRWEVRLGDSFTDYMTSKIKEADAVLFVMTTKSVQAIESPKGEGGAVKFEMQMATARRTAGDMVRLIPIYREGQKTAAHVRDHRYADFRNDAEYQKRLQELIEDLRGGCQAPPVAPVQAVPFAPEDPRKTANAPPERTRLGPGLHTAAAVAGGVAAGFAAHDFANRPASCQSGYAVQTSPHGNSKPTSHSRILFIDDEPYMVRHFTEAICEAGFQVEFCTSALEARQDLMAAESFSAVILDVVMPPPLDGPNDDYAYGWNTGVCLLKQAIATRGRPWTTPVIFLTCRHVHEVEALCQTLPIARHLLKFCSKSDVDPSRFPNFLREAIRCGRHAAARND